MTFTLGCLFALITCATIVLALGRVFGFTATTLIFFAPFPLLGYVVMVRSTMQRFAVNFQTRSVVE